MKKPTKKMTSSSTSQPVAKSSSPPAATPSEAQRLAATILEVLGGLCSPPEAAQALSISLPRYYQLEARALEGLVGALGPRPRGKQPSLENRVKLLEQQLDSARRQCARQEALVRVTRRTFGLAVAAQPKATPPARDPLGRKKRRPVVRALKAARVLQAQADATLLEEVAATGNPAGASLQPATPWNGTEARS
jgi:hypothetical protein